MNQERGCIEVTDYIVIGDELAPSVTGPLVPAPSAAAGGLVAVDSPLAAPLAAPVPVVSAASG